ncbi:40-residue YVTN family beta-propeller repeat-containing protein [Actinopolymorpha cephalotaxi]|uniref:40-residue YVTN family beta-propeller repeat-containing protein n=1 Tax=Actinopolymorpha cephalotaxi TaxID=504797 RepID=A0A1I2PEZ1_9ACTN|nr:hypothetical protein [Actinopolymorpha cephalotaxi]NYH83724.1 YVTN family beta-propeller protein [Actinopolymorpha cephalotaxi]SFG11991.1 40-residue YVTN family beta-propeller repeat-containing protein [Actinopolymorpha cephalotaxi]
MSRPPVAHLLSALLVLAVLATAAAGCWTTAGTAHPTPTRNPDRVRPGAAATAAHAAPHTPAWLPGMPPPLRADDVWAADRPGRLAPAVRKDPYRVYVPNTNSDTVTVIDPKTFKVIKTIPVGSQPQHVVPSWDLRTLWVNNDVGDSLTPIDPRTTKAGKPVPVDDPYNLYFTPDGRYAVVMASLLHRIDFRDPHTMRLEHSTPADCAGVNHADFSADGRYFVVSCEFSSELLKVDTAGRRIVGRIELPGDAKPQDVKLSPDGRTFYVADMNADGVWRVSGNPFRIRNLLPTGLGAHGLYVTRDSRRLLITNRDEGSISVLDFASDRLVGKWRIPGGGSPDMGNLSPDGRIFWLSGRYDGVVYALSTVNGALLARIDVGSGPHGLSVWPQPGRYSLGHTGVMR